MGPSVIVSVAVAMGFLATVAIAATPPYKCFPFSQGGNGTIVPTGDIIREVGTPYEAYCLFDPNYVNAANVAFIHRSPEEQYEIPHEVVNASAIRVEVTHNTSDEYSLFCTVNSQHLCSRAVKIGYPPQDVKNFSCLSKNWKELNCSWAVPYNPVVVNYHLTYVVPGFREQSDCPSKYSYPTYCIWPKEQFGLIVLEAWVIQFNATNKIKREGVQYNYSINIYESVLPDPVMELKGIVNGPWNVTLSWILPHPIDTLPAVVFEVAYRDRHEGDVSEEVPWEGVSQWKAKPDAWERKEVFNKTVNGLRPYGEYDFRVRIHTGFGEIRPHMWSDAEILTLRTSATRPTKAPLTTLGTFEVEETLNYREIFVSWQKIDLRDWNGPELHYMVQAYDDRTNMLIEKPPEDVDIKETYAKFSSMDKYKTYRFEIIPVNSEGPPESDDVKAVVTVQDHGSILKQAPFFKVIAYSGPKETIYSMRWRIDEEELHKIESVTLYWCKKNKYEERCLNKLEWEIVSDLSVNVKNITGLDELPLYLFGISVNSKTSSSGIKWITCIASYGNRPPPLEQFEASVVSSKEIHLQWGLDCKAKAAEPRGFNISYCVKAEQSQNCPTDANMTYFHVSDETAEEYVVGNLQPYTTYIFNIAILTEIGPSKWSKSVQARTRADKPSGPPQDFEVVGYGQTWILLSWRPPMPSERNGDIVKYILTTDSMIAQKDIVANATSNYTQYNVTLLECYTNYKFSIIACTKGLNTLYCGSDQAATVEKRTKIGAPSKIEDINQVDQFLKWDHDCLNGPACFYQLNYTINETAYSHLTDPSAAALNIKDFNLTCTEEKKQIMISLRAVTFDENNRMLYGPAKEESVTCYLPGSYSNDHVPNLSDKLQIFVVQLPQNNQYNTVINLFPIPRDDHVHPITQYLHQQQYLNEVRGSSLTAVKGGSRQAGVSASVRQPVLGFGEDGDKRFQANDLTHMLGREGSNNNNRHVMVEGSHLTGDLNALRQQTGSSKFLKLFGVQARNTFNQANQVNNPPSVADDINLNNVFVHISNNDNSQFKSENNDVSLFRDMSEQPANNIMEILKPSTSLSNEESHQIDQPSKVKQILANTFNCPLFNLMKSKGAEIMLNASSSDYELSIKGTGSAYHFLRNIYRHSALENDKSLTSEVAGSEREDLPLTSDSPSFDYSEVLLQNDIGVKSELYNPHEREEIMTFNTGHRKIVFDYLLPSTRDDFSDKTSIPGQNHVSEAVIHDLRLVMAENNDVQKTPSMLNADERDILSTSESVITSIPELDTGHGSQGSHLNAVALQISTPADDIVSPSNHHAMEPEQGSLASPNYNALKDLHSESSIFGQQSRSNQPQFYEIISENDADMQNGAEQQQPVASLIYRIVGNFNGNIGGVTPQDISVRRARERGVGKDVNYELRTPRDFITDDHSRTISGSYRQVVSPEEVLIDKRFRSQHSLSSSNYNSNSGCPFVDLMRNKSTKVRFSAPGDGKFEFNVQGKGSFYDLLEKLYHESSSNTRGVNAPREQMLLNSEYAEVRTDSMINESPAFIEVLDPSNVDHVSGITRSSQEAMALYSENSYVSGRAQLQNPIPHAPVYFKLVPARQHQALLTNFPSEAGRFTEERNGNIHPLQDEEFARENYAKAHSKEVDLASIQKVTLNSSQASVMASSVPMYMEKRSHPTRTPPKDVFNVELEADDGIQSSQPSTLSEGSSMHHSARKDASAKIFVLHK